LVTVSAPSVVSDRPPASRSKASMSVVLIKAFEVPNGQEDRFLADWQHAARLDAPTTRVPVQQAAPEPRPGRGVPLRQRRRLGVRHHFGKAAASPEFQRRISGMTVRAHPVLYRVVIQ
jgi:hypothetical protein